MSFQASARSVTPAVARERYDAGLPIAMAGTRGWFTPRTNGTLITSTFYTRDELPTYARTWEGLTNAGNNTTAHSFATPVVSLVKNFGTCYACDSAAVKRIGASRPVSEPFTYGMVASRPACAVHSV